MPDDIFDLLDTNFDSQDDGDPHYIPVQDREVRHDD